MFQLPFLVVEGAPFEDKNAPIRAVLIQGVNVKEGTEA